MKTTDDKKNVKQSTQKKKPIEAKKKEPNYRTIIPLILSETSSINPILNLTDDITFQKISAIDFDALLDTDQYDKDVNYLKYIQADSMAFYISTNEQKDFENYSNQIISIIKFILLMVTEDKELIYFPYAFLINTDDNKVKEFIETDDAKNIHKQKSQKIALRKEIPPDELSIYANIVYKVAIANPNINFMLQRFFSSQLKLNKYDKIVDLSICLETMIVTSTEISFQFALSHTKLYNDNKENTKKNHELLKHFYNARSKIVHGDVKNGEDDIKYVIDNWEFLRSIALKNMHYYFLYNAEHRDVKWKDHLANILIGIESPINSFG